MAEAAAKTGAWESAFQIKRAVSARTLTTFGIGGAAERFAEVQSIAELRSLIEAAADAGVAWRMIGAGSNVVFRDEGIPGLVIRLGRGFGRTSLATQADSFEQWLENSTLHGIPSERQHNEPVYLFALGAASLMSLSREMSAAGLSGLEFAAGIPASLGGALVMNAGAHGEELSNIVQSVAVLSAGGKLVLRSASEMNYSYRHSELLPGEVVIGSVLRLRPADPEQIRQRRSSCLEYRKKTQPLTMPSAGSAFRNPSRQNSPDGKISQPAAAQLLEEVGLKGYAAGGVSYSTLHSNWLVRTGEQARTSELETLIDLGIRKVRDRFDIELRPEIVIW